MRDGRADPYTVLVTDADYKHALGIVRTLGKAGMRVYVLSRRPGSLCSRSRYCAGELLTMDYSDSRFAGHLTGLIDMYHIDQIIPVGARSYETFSAIKESIGTKAALVMADREKLSICFSKRSTCEFARGLGIRVPETLYPERMSDIPPLARDIRYPCVIKGVYEKGNSVVAYVEKPGDLPGVYKCFCGKNGFSEKETLPMIQEYIHGEPYGFFAVFDRGRCGETFQHHRLRQFPPAGGPSTAAESARHPAIHEAGKKILSALGWHGIAMVEFKLTPEGIPVLLEINAKFWGSLDLSLAAGVNFPLSLVRIAQGLPVAYSEEYRHPVRYHWPFEGDIKHAFYNPRNAYRVIRDLMDPRVRSNLWVRDDLSATVQMGKIFLSGIINRFLRKKRQ